MNEQKLIAQRIEDLEASVAYFASGNKAERERWVVEEFVQNLGLTPVAGEIISIKDDPPDVEFRDARFEIKEILDPGRRRHDEYKQELARVRRVEEVGDLLTPFEPKEVGLDEIYRLCHGKAVSLGTYASDFKMRTDLLLYVNLKEVMYVREQPYPDTSELAATGWRSVSFLMGRRSSCFYAGRDAADFIKQAAGRVHHRP
jgi:hypothetical protein